MAPSSQFFQIREHIHAAGPARTKFRQRALVTEAAALHLGDEFGVAAANGAQFDEAVTEKPVDPPAAVQRSDQHVQLDVFAEQMLRAHQPGFDQPHAHRSEHLYDQIVIVSFGDFAANEFAGRERLALAEVGDINLAVDLGGVHLGASLPEQIGFLRRALDEQIELAADQRLLAAAADLLLDLHELLATALDLARRNLQLALGLARFGAFLVGVTEDTHPVEFGGADEVAKRFEIFGCLAGETDDERRAQRDAGNRAAHLLNRLQEDVRAGSALHALQNRRRSVL